MFELKPERFNLGGKKSTSIRFDSIWAEKIHPSRETKVQARTQKWKKNAAVEPEFFWRFRHRLCWLPAFLSNCHARLLNDKPGFRTKRWQTSKFKLTRCCGGLDATRFNGLRTSLCVLAFVFCPDEELDDGNHQEAEELVLGFILIEDTTWGRMNTAAFDTADKFNTRKKRKGQTQRLLEVHNQNSNKPNQRKASY